MTTQEEILQVHSFYDTILILDFGSQYSHLITRRVREFGVYCEMLPCTQKIKGLSFNPKGVILSGSPYSVYDKDAPRVDSEVFNLGVPVLGICYGLQEIAWNHGGSVAPCNHREYGHAILNINHQGHPFIDRLFDGIEGPIQVWMSHGDQLDKVPESFKVIGNTLTAPFAAIAHEEKHLFEIERIRQIVGPNGQVVGAVSGGVDSTVAARLMKEAIGDRFHAILVDNGVMRLNECETVKKVLGDHLGINLKVVDAADMFLDRLKGVTDPERKRKIIGNTFIEVFELESLKIDQETKEGGHGQIEYLLQGTLYPDVIESISFKGPSATIKTHHNVGGLLEDMKLKLIEPLRELFKDEVRELGKVLKIDEDLIWRHPFPGPGIAIRVLGEVTPSQVAIARAADHIYIDEIKKAGLYRKISQAYAALLPVKAVGVMGDRRTYEQVIVLRAVETTDFMTADWYPFPYDILKKISNRIINEVKGVNRVTYDISSKPPATIEW
ncbi:1596_t:CDS:10 [Funneliformis geosporum]|nr:1596_t:CDS:10 [Funneliformis geosporum]